ncbi:MAG TPA: hypothetical protein VKF14_22115 [Candidatus Dormibacteraeota bacterium]|nr:hypothetical protein [Candidatus Dormibacteraeota bacterium]
MWSSEGQRAAIAFAERRVTEVIALKLVGWTDLCVAPYALVFAELYTPAFAGQEPALAAAVRANMLERPLQPELLAMHYRCSQHHDALDALPRIANPTLVIHESDDQLNLTARAHLLAGRI